MTEKFKTPGPKFAILLDSTVSEYEIESVGHYLTIKNVSDIIRLKKEIRMSLTLRQENPIKMKLGDINNEEPRSPEKIMSVFHQKQMQEKREAEFAMPVINYLIFNVFGHLDTYPLREDEGRFFLANEDQYAVLDDSLDLFIQNHKACDQDQFDLLTPKWLAEAMSQFNIRKKSLRPLSIYFAGSLFTNKDLIGNMYLVDSIHRLSGYRYRCILPQNLQQMSTDPAEIKNNDLIQVRDTDGILVSFDGTELDSGTVVEFMAAKFLNKPAVIYRTDFRSGGDTPGGDPWNLMLYNYPRTQHVRETSHIMDIYQEHLQKYQHMKGNYSHIVSQEVSNTIAKSLIEKLDKVFTGYNRDENDDCAKFANGINMKDMFDQFCGLGKKFSY